MLKYNLAVLLFACLLSADSVAKNTISGFDVGNASIPVDEILSGGPPRDGIPAINNPVFMDAKLATFLSNDDRVIGIARQGIAKAYPIAILNWHEIVNDRMGSESIVVTYCPLCGTGMIFAADSMLSFGVSGLLYNSDVLMYDRQTSSLWSQLKMEAVTGKRLGQKLELLPASHTTWGDWLERHPATQVLSDQTGFDRDYDRNPYAGYSESRRLFFPVSGNDARYHPKEQVIGVRIGNSSWAWPFVELSQSPSVVEDEIAGQRVEVHYDSAARTGSVFTEDGKEIPSTIAFWFAWINFYPESRVYQAP